MGGLAREDGRARSAFCSEDSPLGADLRDQAASAWAGSVVRLRSPRPERSRRAPRAGLGLRFKRGPQRGSRVGVPRTGARLTVRVTRAWGGRRACTPIPKPGVS